MAERNRAETRLEKFHSAALKIISGLSYGRKRFVALKALNRTAQGNALGVGDEKQSEALKGRYKNRA